MTGRWPGLSTLWAARDVLRRPGESLLLALALAAFVAVTGTVLLLVQATEQTARAFLEAGPSLVVRRVDSAGFRPIPEAAAARVAAVPGALRVRTRVWGTVALDSGAVAVIGVAAADGPLGLAGVDTLAEGQALIGPGVALPEDSVVSVRGPGEALYLRILGRLDDQVGLAAHDALLVGKADARRLLGLPADHASDLVLDVNFATEEAAIRPDLARALPFPVRITTRTEAIGRYAGDLGRRGGLVLLLLLPAALALAYLTLGALRARGARAREVGLLKALGWTSRDVFRLCLLRALWIGLPGAALGLVVAWALVMWPGVTWVGSALLGWQGPPPALVLDAGGASLTLVEVALLALGPWLVASLWPAVRAATRDPSELLGEGGAG